MAESISEQVRRFVNEHYIAPARAAGTQRVDVRVGTVHSQLNLVSRLPLVAGALGANIFGQTYGVKLLRREGPQNGANLVLTFEVLP